MGNRLSNIYTRTGDDGTTGLGDGGRVRKDDLRVETFGTVDELNCALGLMLAHDMPANIDRIGSAIQQKLFDLGGELCIPGAVTMSKHDVTAIESELDELNADLPPLKDFVLPGGSSSAAACHMARAICRRAERRMVSLAQETDINEYSIRYLNRLSDLLFVIARALNTHESVPEVLWTGGKLREE
ncbi:MAG: cob(I)yrinic acid a,c-diamide adenosyltransferase [Gammaproteobacteria bacterium]